MRPEERLPDQYEPPEFHDPLDDEPESRPWYRKPVVLIGWGLLVVILIGLIAFGITELLGGDQGTAPAPSTSSSATPTTTTESSPTTTTETTPTTTTTTEAQPPQQPTGQPTRQPTRQPTQQPSQQPPTHHHHLPPLPPVITIPEVPTTITVPPGLR